MRASHLNWALVANEQNVAKARMFKATVHVFSPALYFSFKLLGLLKSRFGYFCGLGLLFQKPIYLLKLSFVLLSFSNELFGVVSSFSTALLIPSGFSDKRFETAPDLSFSKRVKTVLAKR
ncbi:hypothetical protein [Vibrio parahaemolyticus]|uniref:hypothetical protein n=1 Tax=Vibrio parahaemolyticus TaxID=670 RepID=UPI0015DF2713|nr:hypothetical protein [Vibrio parahaemolyticus]HCH5323579.1 hypothetical protein [Vibrio parahaemolyticus]